MMNIIDEGRYLLTKASKDWQCPAPDIFLEANNITQRSRKESSGRKKRELIQKEAVQPNLI